ncbi:HAD family phosphatase [Nocardiopsis sp. MG754419]|uniref:HAD family hydrolase n=1 Tax=Nocardiopsis sp. MG754419 TaxID=2259865 RepID=UPI001BA9C809|nr:HAD family phosphatase [Nocardiopsis sp. MG754419]MBR8742584.1 HAD family phosphatase [Nocardiopsis sp. MG754419]
MNAPAHPRTCPGSASASGRTPAIPDGVEALILDFDGTLADTTPGHERALRAALRPHGVDLDAHWYRSHVGLSIHDLLAALPGGEHLPHEEIIRRSRGHLSALLHTIAPLSCVVALLRAARRAHLPCAVASGAARLLVEPGIRALGLEQEFATVVTREDAPRGKPAPDLYLTAAHRLGVPPSACLAVDDAPGGIASARAAGMRVLTVVDGHPAPTDDHGTGTACGDTTGAEPP